MKLGDTIDVLSVTTNAISCFILGLVIRLVFKISHQVRVGKNVMATKRQINALVTTSHLIVTVSYSFLNAYVTNASAFHGESEKVNIAQTFFAALLDIFLSVVLWIILDEDKSPSVLIDSEKVYAVLDVAKPDQPALNQDCETEEEKDQEEDQVVREDSRRYSGVSRRMIDQFFTDVEGPDRDWADRDLDFLDDQEEDWKELIVDE